MQSRNYSYLKMFCKQAPQDNLLLMVTLFDIFYIYARIVVVSVIKSSMNVVCVCSSFLMILIYSGIKCVTFASNFLTSGPKSIDETTTLLRVISVKNYPPTTS